MAGPLPSPQFGGVPVNHNAKRAALVGYIARTGDTSHASVRRAMFYASAAASFCVEGIGTERLVLATKGDLAVRIDTFTKMVDYGGSLALR